jgi:hypothetical protein
MRLNNYKVISFDEEFFEDSFVPLSKQFKPECYLFLGSLALLFALIIYLRIQARHYKLDFFEKAPVLN